MVDQASQLIEEIQQIKAQYVEEVGNGRRVWPRSIKERAARLDELGVPVKAVSKQTGICYETLILWRYNRRRAPAQARFHEVKVATQGAIATPTKVVSDTTSISKSVSVTVPNFEIQPGAAVNQGAKLTTPNGFVIEGLDATAVALVVGRLLQQGSQQGGSHAS